MPGYAGGLSPRGRGNRVMPGVYPRVGGGTGLCRVMPGVYPRVGGGTGLCRVMPGVYPRVGGGTVNCPAHG